MRHMRRHSCERPYLCEEPDCGHNVAIRFPHNTHMFSLTCECHLACEEPNCDYL